MKIFSKDRAVVQKKPTALTSKEVISLRPQIFSRHPSHNVLRGKLDRNTFTSCIRFGSETPSVCKVQLNSIESIKNSSSKLRMKNCFTEMGVKTAEWWTSNGKVFFKSGNDKTPNKGFGDLPYPIVAKKHFGSRGQGNSLLQSGVALKAFMVGKDLSHYIFEKFYNYIREYRLHVTSEGCFYACRKMLKKDAPDDAKWFRNDSNCVWIMEQNEMFDKPSNWEVIINECVKALNSCKLDFGACDLRVQSAMVEGKKRKDVPDFIVVEINSAPSFGVVTAEKYKETLPLLIIKKSKKALWDANI